MIHLEPRVSTDAVLFFRHFQERWTGSFSPPPPPPTPPSYPARREFEVTREPSRNSRLHSSSSSSHLAIRAFLRGKATFSTLLPPLTPAARTRELYEPVPRFVCFTLPRRVIGADALKGDSRKRSQRRTIAIGVTAAWKLNPVSLNFHLF